MNGPKVCIFMYAGITVLLFASLSRAYGTADEVRRNFVSSQLKCEYRINPLCIDEAHPLLSWVVTSGKRGERQTAYRVLVSSEPEKLALNEGDVWDSKKIESASTVNIVYGGKALESGRRYWWKVRVWDSEGRECAWSEDAWWEMGLLAPADWKAVWIGDGRKDPVSPEGFYEDDPAPLFRKEFKVAGEVKSARLYISGLGYYEAYLNGEKTGDHVLDPGWTVYGKRVFYTVYDVTAALAAGMNTVGVTLGNGWYNPLPLVLFNKFNLREFMTIGRPKFIAQLNIEYADGTKQEIASDGTWKTAEGPILRNNVYLGEVYDARLEQSGWNKNGFDDGAWKPVSPADPPPGRLRVQHQPPIRVTKTLKPVARTEPLPDVYIFDMGQNFAGVARLKVSGPAGTEVRMRYGELLYPDGTLNFRSTVTCHIVKQGDYKPGGPGAPDTAWQADTYILKGKGDEVFASRFGFNGFRYVEVTGYPGVPPLDAVEGLRMNADFPKAGDFECSNPMFNRIQDIVHWTFMSNVFSIQSDCPAREKFGYGGDIVTSGEAFIYNYDMTNFYVKSIRDFADDARPKGGMTECAPYNGIADGGLGDGSGPIGWTLAHPYMQEMLYRFYGDRRIIEEQYAPTKRLIEYIRSQAPDHIVEPGIGDHAGIDPKIIPLTSTAFYYHHVRLLVQFAGILGKSDDERNYAALAETIKAAFIAKFLKPGTGQFDAHTQACQIFALYYDLMPPDGRNRAFEVLLNEILEKHNGHLSTGIFGTKMLFDVTRTYDRPDIAYTVANQKTFPGWGHMVENGATTVWESWAGRQRASFNHPMFGSISEWFYRTIAGINPHPEAEGFDRIIIKPFTGGDLTWAKARYQSIRGDIRSSWRKDGSGLLLDISVPANTTATVYIPSASSGAVMESGVPAADAEGVAFVRMEGQSAVFAVQSGDYSFAVR